jgi:hypothetical protein
MPLSLTAAQLDQLQLLRAIVGMTQQPASAVEPNTAPIYDHDPILNHQNLTLLSSAVRAATVTGADRVNPTGTGVIVVIDVTAVPGVDTVTVFIEGKDPASGKYYTILQSAAIVAVSTVVLRVYPGLTAAANLVVSDVLPRTWRVRVVHSAGSNFTYSLGACVLAPK